MSSVRQELGIPSASYRYAGNKDFFRVGSGFRFAIALVSIGVSTSIPLKLLCVRPTSITRSEAWFKSKFLRFFKFINSLSTSDHPSDIASQPLINKLKKCTYHTATQVRIYVL